MSLFLVMQKEMTDLFENIKFMIPVGQDLDTTTRKFSFGNKDFCSISTQPYYTDSESLTCKLIYQFINGKMSHGG